MRLFAIALTALLWAFPAWGFDHQYGTWQSVLERHLHQKGRQTYVGYKALQTNPTALNQAAHQMAAVGAKDFAQWTKEQKLAFWINAYNIFTVKLVVAHYPVESIKDIGAFWQSPFGLEFFQLFGEDYTLDRIEHQRLRVNFNEPRIHFALVCASMSCPNLSPEPYRPDRLDTQLEQALRRFLADGDKNRIVKGTLYLSKIFRWFEEDFTDQAGSLANFLLPRWPEAAQLAEQDKVDYLEYSWVLNDWSQP